MDFSLNEVQSMLTDSIEKFLDNDYAFETRQQYAASELGYSPDVWQMFAELGWTAVPFSEADGGFDGGPIDTMLMKVADAYEREVDDAVEGIMSLIEPLLIVILGVERYGLKVGNMSRAMRKSVS